LKRVDEADKKPQRGDCDRSVDVPRSGWATAGAWLRITLQHFRASASPDGGDRDDELERLYDLQWQISDSARRYRDLLDAQAGLIVHRDSDGRVVFANRAYLTAFGFTESELTGRQHEPHVLDSDPGCAARNVEQIETVYGPRWIVWEESNCATVSNGQAGTQRSGRDVTDERLAAEVLRQARDAALEASRAKSRFLATMSHEIRTPMNGILGMTDLLMDGPLTGDQRIYTKTIAQSARALMLLIDEILDFSRIEAGKLVLAERPFSITDTVAACIALLEPKAASKGLELSWRIDGEAPPLLSGDEARVRQILLNLVSNAVKFTDAGSVRVGISATEGPGELVRVRIHVTDTGIGLTAAECVAIFAEFEQAEATVRRQDGGSGLGLAIARRIARAMKGDITAVSEPGQGSTFTAELGLERADANAAALRSALDRAALVSRPPLKPAGASGAPARVLLAEDNPVNALLATRLLERDGCEVVRVATGDEAVAAVARWLSGQDRGYDLLLMDIYMPRLDGIEATRAIRRLLATAEQTGMTKLPIIAVTANAYAEDRRTYLAAGMDDHLAKPFDGEALKAILERWLHAKRRQSPAA
jgi:PAS domain S-box-containing protein